MFGCRGISTTSPDRQGSIAGRVVLYDSTLHILTDYSGVRVSVDGTNLSVFTDTSGSWRIEGIPEGSENITATKSGFGTYHWYQLDISDGEVDEETIGLDQLCSYTPILDTAYWNGTEMEVGPRGAFDSLPSFVQIAGYCDLTADVRPEDHHLAVSHSTDSKGGGGIAFYYDELLADGVRPGQTLYITCANVFVKSPYGMTRCKTTYVAPLHNSQVCFASTGPRSNAIAITMP